MIEKQETLEAPVGFSTLRETVLDFERYADFLDQIDTSKVLERNSNRTKVYFESSFGKTIEYALEFDHGDPKKIEWKMVKGNLFKMNSGFWELEPLDPEKTRLTYKVQIKTAFLVPEFLVQQYLDSNLRQSLDQFVNEARNRAS